MIEMSEKRIAGVVEATAAADERLTGPMPTRALGKTGWQASVLTLGGVKWDTCVPEADAVELIQRAVELGVNTFDTAHMYGGGESERRLGVALHGVGRPVFVSTKITERSREGARRQMDISLQRLGMNRVDLMFVHGLDNEEDYQKVVGPDGVLRAIEEYRSAGHVRFVGVSGHWYRPNMEKILGEYAFDAVLCPVGLFNLAYGYSYADTVLPLARQRGMAAMGMKVFGAGRVKHAASIEPYLRYSLNVPVDSLVIGCDSIAQLEQTVRIVKSQPPPLSVAEQEALFPECRQITQSWDRGEFNWVSHYR
ncbi:MAG TPA: aldo/keto reductase [Verrucomicrobiae bacterium]|nr:aldo/keto reductase [Verrucomicrobiae bacterium]